MVVLMEEFHGLTLKRKGADEPELFDVGGDDRSGFPLACRATKMRRLVPPDGLHRQDDGDVAMGNAPAPVPGAGDAERKAMAVYGAPAEDARRTSRLRPWAGLRAGADWIRAMLREADSRTVRELLANTQEQGADLALAVVPWVAPSPAEETEPSSTAEEAEDDGGSEDAAAMDVEEAGDQGHRWTGHPHGSAGASCVEGYAFRWPQHCMAPPQLPAVAQASPMMWSW